MNRAPVIFLATLAAFAISFALFVYAPQWQVGRQAQTPVVGSTDTYPTARPGQAAQGAQVYRAQGCVYCHSQQVRQTGVNFEVRLTDAGTNLPAVSAALQKLNPAADVTNVPLTVLRGVVEKSQAEAAQKSLKAAGAKAQVLLLATGPDIARGWGARRTVAADYLFDYPVMTGSQRIGPDLANVGLRLPDANWHLLHLYNPKITTTNSVMPSYRYLFETRKIVFGPSRDALSLPKEFAPSDGYEVLPKPEARALAAYLQSLRADAPLFEAPTTGIAGK
jgi:cytochrome c oxidase cbb3-type subunit II